MFKLIVLICCFLPTLLLSTHVYAHKDEALKVAFIRGGELWVKQADKELQLTHENPVFDPKWSYNGAFIAYSSGKDADSISVYSFKTNKSYSVAKGGSHYEWAPTSNILAFQIQSLLNTTNVHDEPTSHFENVSFGVGNYSWLPDGKGFLVSSSASLLPTGWTQIGLFLVPLDAHADPAKAKPLYTLPPESKDFFAVSTSSFKWSADGKWIAFVAEPTASLASDQSTLCLLSADAKTFKTVAKMLHYEDWFQWAPTRSSIAYIQGEDRQIDRNKRLKVIDLPSFKESSLGAKGYVDQGFTWINDQAITLSRAKENLGAYNAVPKNLPALFKVQLANNQQKQLTYPPKNSGDFSPFSLINSQKLTWFHSDEKLSNLWTANLDVSKARELIHNVDLGMSYYGKIFANSVIDWYEPDDKKTIAVLTGEPSYAKWGKLAMSQVKNKYQADIVDYKHLGRKEISPKIAEEDFKFWLRSGSREFGVFVQIRFESSTEKVQSISIQEG
ncbi:DUF3889 domain-containing protein [Paenibacillus psychroresistens]|uniref:DUF3889 domain-containing protein n=1 Tax=Paenibacillus psychroresistens TaxID=1778678 RepID=A0A6B8RNH8_9BACL|nr:DUF3889 domain-containing protein [Paenibacillus psychroresistens]QGQ97880.1 DUF3889 domain-containing protein [Paenibacillus psychroresistens]